MEHLMARLCGIITDLANADRLFGVDSLRDGKAAIATALATGARFMREVVTGVWNSDMGLWNTDPPT
jgi:uncharacterized protein